jgi:hypothetical protein
MAVNAHIQDGRGTTRKAKVLENHSLLVGASSPPLAAVGTPSEFQFLSGNLGTEGLNAGSTDANVDGSATNVEFFVESVPEYDQRIKKLLIYVQDTQVTHSGFGNLPALTNGINISVIEAGVETFLIENGTSFAELIQQTFAERPWGGDATSFELTNVQGTEDAQVLPMDIGALVPEGVRIGRDTKDRLRLVVRDDLTGLTRFTIRVAGFKHFPPAER